MSRLPKVQNAYERYSNSFSKNVCKYCGDFNITTMFEGIEINQLVEQTTSFWIIQNSFPYKIWDKYKVISHLLVIPKEHIINLGIMYKSDWSRLNYILSKYEAQGYSTYIKSNGNGAGAISHLHFDLIKLEPKQIKWIVYKDNPYILLTNQNGE